VKRYDAAKAAWDKADVGEPTVADGVLTFTVSRLGVFAITGARPGTDVNADGVVNAVDVQLVINAVLGFETGRNCDVNGDGLVNAVDVQIMINAALGG
jgi:hypothetical protein